MNKFRYRLRNGDLVIIDYRVDELQEGERWVSTKKENEDDPVHHFLINKNGDIIKGFNGKFKNVQDIAIDSATRTLAHSNDRKELFQAFMSLPKGTTVYLPKGKRSQKWVKDGLGKWHCGDHLRGADVMSLTVLMQGRPTKIESPKPKVEVGDELDIELAKCKSVKQLCETANAYFESKHKAMVFKLSPKVELGVAKEWIKTIDELTDKFVTTCTLINTNCKSNTVRGQCSTTLHVTGDMDSEIQLKLAEVGTEKANENYWEKNQEGVPFGVPNPKEKANIHTLVHEFGHSIMGCDLGWRKKYPKATQEIESIYLQYKNQYRQALQDYKEINRRVATHQSYENLIAKYQKETEMATTSHNKEWAKSMLDTYVQLRDKYALTDSDKKRSQEVNKELTGIISRYSMTNVEEMIAESFADCTLNQNPNPWSKKVYDIIVREVALQK